MPDEYISRETALEDFESCNAENPNWTPQRVKTLLLRQPAVRCAVQGLYLQDQRPVLFPHVIYQQSGGRTRRFLLLGGN